MKFFKKIEACICFLFLSSGVFAASGLMHGEKNIKVVQSKWFDIIYGEECADSAAVLYANADAIYLDLAKMYGWTDSLCRMPVVLTTQVESFNAYYTGGYYNHIVLYVTTPIDDLENQPDSLLWTFRHELTHAFTYNMKNDFFKTLDLFFTDNFNLSILTVTPGVAEGATLTSESYEGNGRLNDEFTKHTVKQAKIEGKFPNFSDVQGSKDIYPSGDFYAFNGAFHEYLQKQYGLGRYAKFWYNCVNNSITVSSAFRKAYGVSLKKVWRDFEYQYEVPRLRSNPIEDKVSKDFFVPDLLDYSQLNDKGAVIDCLSSSEKGLTYIDLKTSTVFFVDRNAFSQVGITPKKLFQKYGIESAVQSPDGKYIAVTYVDDASATYKSYIAVYNTESKKWYEPHENGLTNGIIIQNDNDYYLISLAFKGEHSNIRISKLICDEKDEIKEESLPLCFEFGRNQVVNYFTKVSEDIFAYILKDELDYSIQLMDINGNIIADYPLLSTEKNPNFIMRYLSYDEKENALYFSWVSKNTMPRVGKLDLDAGEYILSNQDISGGIFNPVVFEDELVYIGKFYQQDRLFRKAETFEDSISYSVYEGEVENENETDENTVADANSEDFTEASADFEEEDFNSLRREFAIDVPSLEEVGEVKKYNPFNYLRRGLWLPVSIVSSKSFDTEHYGTYELSTGLTYITGNPWDSEVIQLSVGYGTPTNSTGIAATYSSGTDTSLFNWSTGVFSEFDVKGFKAAEVEAGFSSVLHTHNFSKITIAPSMFTHVGRSNLRPDLVTDPSSYNSETDTVSWEELSEAMSKMFGYARSESMDFYLFNQEILSITYDNIRKVDDNRFGLQGFIVGTAPVFKISRNLTTNTADYILGDITLFGEVYIPRLLPIENKYGQTTNLPVKIFGSLFSTSLVYSDFISIPVETYEGNIKVPDFALLATEVLLYGKEIQKAIEFLPLFYLNDFKISFVGAVGYDYPALDRKEFSWGFTHTPEVMDSIAKGKLQPVSIFSLKCALGLNTFNVGQYARSSFKSYIYISSSVLFDGLHSKSYFSSGIDINF